MITSASSGVKKEKNTTTNNFERKLHRRKEIKANAAILDATGVHIRGFVQIGYTNVQRNYKNSHQGKIIFN